MMLQYYYNMSNATNFIELLVDLNEVTGELFGISIMIMIFFIMFLSMKNFETEKALTSSLFITSMSGFFLFLMGIVSEFIFLGSFVILIGTLFLLKRVGTTA